MLRPSSPPAGRRRRPGGEGPLDAGSPTGPRGHLELIAADSPAAAARLDQLFSDAATRLADFPMLGRAGRVAGTREVIPHESYCPVYEIQAEAVWILTVIHTARQWPPAEG